MEINWKVRFKNKVFLMTFFSLVVGVIYNILKLFKIFPAITQNEVLDIIGQILTILGAAGVIVDPTTVGISDSKRAMEYTEPWDDNKPPEAQPTPEE